LKRHGPDEPSVPGRAHTDRFAVTFSAAARALRAASAENRLQTQRKFDSAFLGIDEGDPSLPPIPGNFPAKLPIPAGGTLDARSPNGRLVGVDWPPRTTNQF